jgi:glycosyltransferase involved in cell wall biosynthesis
VIAAPEVSVVMAVHNGERFLAAALQSVLSQEDVRLELVVVDDGSADGSGEMLARTAEAEPRLRVVTQPKTGLTKALMRGCAEATGTFVARQDADDLSAPGRLRKLADLLRARADVAVVSSWCESIGPGDEPLTTTRYPGGTEAGTDALLRQRRNPVGASTMFRREDYEAVGGFREDFYFAQDSDLWLRLVDRGAVLYAQEILYRFRVAEGSISAENRGSQLRLYELAWECRRARLAGLPEEPYLEEARKIRPTGNRTRRRERGGGSYFIGRTLLKNRDRRAEFYFRTYLKRAPFDARGWLGLAQALLLPRGQSGLRTEAQEAPKA